MDQVVEATLPIGVFDSGMGGLTVLSALKQRLPQEHFIYLGDTARLPYGTKSAGTVTRYALQASSKLVERGVKALVVACNTASAVSIAALQAQFKNIPVFGVVEPGAQAAAQVSEASGVLIMATQSTISGGAYQRALGALLPLATPIYGRACPMWVTLAELGSKPQDYVRRVLAQDLLGVLSNTGPTTMLLGCTHFPVFKQHLQYMCGDDVTIVDSAQTTADVVQAYLQAHKLLNTQQLGLTVSYLATDGVERFRQVSSTFLQGSDLLVDQVELVDL